MPKILFVIGSLSTGGAERHLSIILPQLKKRGFDVEVFCLAQKGELAGVLEQQGVKVFTSAKKQNKFIRLINVFLALRKHISKNKPDIIHMFLPESYLIGGLNSFFYPKIKFIMSRRSLNFYQKKYPFVAIIERMLHQRMSFVLGNSKAVVSQLQEEGVKDGKLGLIYNGIELEKYDLQKQRSQIRKQLEIDDDCLVLVIVANLFFYKGHADLIKALELIKPKMPNKWKLLIVGRDCGEELNIKTQAEQAGFLKNICFMGTREDVAQILNASDIGFSCSHEEGFSNSVLEMMASSLGVIATDAGGNAEAVLNKEAGLVVPIKDYSKMAEAIVNFFDDDYRQKMGNNARKRVCELFSLEKCVSDYERLYKNII